MFCFTENGNPDHSSSSLRDAISFGSRSQCSKSLAERQYADFLRDLANGKYRKSNTQQRYYYELRTKNDYSVITIFKTGIQMSQLYSNYCTPT